MTRHSIFRCVAAGLAVLAMGAAAQGLAAGRELDAYRTRVMDQADKRLKLDDRGEVEITFGRLGSIGGSRPDAVLFGSGLRWQIWIEGEGAFDCDVEKKPGGIPRRAAEMRLQEVQSEGAVLVMEDGTKFEVEDRDARVARRWRPGSAVLVIEESEAINLDTSRDVLSVTRLP